MSRFSRQKGLADFSKTIVLIVGVGGVGSWTAIQLAEMGVKKLVLFDWDVVEECNLSRQFFIEKSLGMPKVSELKKTLKKINKNVEVEAHAKKFTGIENLKVDYVLDGSDNRSARLAMDFFSLKNKVPWIFCGVKEFDLMLSTFIPSKTKPFKEIWNAKGSDDCTRVTASTVMAASSVQVSELISLMAGKPNLAGKLFYGDIKTLNFKTIRI